MLAAGHSCAHGQTPVKHDDIAGVWEGKYTSNHNPGGSLRLTVQHDSVVVIVMEFPGTNIAPSPWKSITHSNDDKISWTQEIMSTPCEGKGTFDGSVFKGEVQCGPAQITFDATKKK